MKDPTDKEKLRYEISKLTHLPLDAPTFGPALEVARLEVGRCQNDADGSFTSTYWIRCRDLVTQLSNAHSKWYAIRADLE